MNIAVITGTPVKGITYYIKETYLKALGDGHHVTEFYPSDFPEYCVGCKGCFLRGENTCLHYHKVEPIWNAILEADLLVFAYPVYALRAPGAVKSLLDHFCVHWMPHRPESVMFGKTAVILTNSVGAPNGSAQKDVVTSLQWMGVSRIYRAGMGMMGDIFIESLSTSHKDSIEKNMSKLAAKTKACRPVTHKNPKVWLFFQFCRLQHAMVYKGEQIPSLDNLHYVNHGWIKERKAESK